MSTWRAKLGLALLLSIALAACSATPAAFSVRSAAIEAGMLNVHLQWRPDERVLEALENGIALDFTVSVQAQIPGTFGWPRSVAAQERHLQLRYFPLSRQYQLRDFDLGQTRSYAARALALAALEDLQLPLLNWQAPGAERYTFSIALDRDALPGALRLPALILPAWRRCTGEFAWPARTG